MVPNQTKWITPIVAPVWSYDKEYRMPDVDYSLSARLEQLRQYSVDKAQLDNYHVLWEFYKDGAWCTCDQNFEFQDDRLYRRKDSSTIKHQMQELLQVSSVWCGVGDTLVGALLSSKWNLVRIVGMSMTFDKRVLYHDVEGALYEYVAPTKYPTWVCDEFAQSIVGFKTSY